MARARGLHREFCKPPSVLSPARWSGFALYTALLFFIGAGSFAGFYAAEESHPMTPPETLQAGELSTDLVPTFSDSAASMAVTRITGREAAHSREAGVESGLLQLTVVQVIHSDSLHVNESILTPYSRVADAQIRRRNQFNAWNSLSLDRDELLLIAVRPQRPPSRYEAIAAVRLSSANDPEIAAASDCYRIEAALGEDEHSARPMLLRALESESELSRFYALNALTHRQILSRLDSAGVLSEALSSGKLSSSSRLDLGFHLASGNLYDEKLGADTVNVNIVSAFAAQLVESTDRKSRDQWLKFLSGCLSRHFSADEKTDRETRAALIKAVRTPAPQTVVSALSAAVKAAPSPAYAKPAKRLLDAWQSASGLKP